MADPLAMKNKFYEWTNEMFAQSPFDLKTTNLMSMIAALVIGNQGAVSYFYFSAKRAGATDVDLAAATDIAAAATGLNLYTLVPKE